MPPGSATKASERSNMMRFRTCMSSVMISSSASLKAISRLRRNSGITPVILPPRSLRRTLLHPSDRWPRRRILGECRGQQGDGPTRGPPFDNLDHSPDAIRNKRTDFLLRIGTPH